MVAASFGSLAAAGEAAADAPAVAKAAPPARSDDGAVEDVVVRAPAPRRAASDATLDGDVLRAAPHRTASDTLSVVPGVFVTQHSGEGKAHQIFLRGFDAVHGQDVELSVGGLPVNEVSNLHGQGYADLHFVMPEVIRRVDASFGPFSPSQGDFAVAGSMAMHLGYAEPGITAKGSLGTFGARRAFLAYRPRGSSEETFVAFESYATDGFGPSRAAHRTSLVAQAAHDIGRGANVRVLLTSAASRFDSAGVVRARDVESGLTGRFATYDGGQGGDSSRQHLLVELRRDREGERFSLSPFVALRSMTLRQNFTGALARGSEERPTDPTLDRVEQRNDSLMVGARGSYRRALVLTSPRDALEAGAFARSDVLDQRQASASPTAEVSAPSDVDARVRATNLAGYLDAELHPLRRLAIRGGVRADALAYQVEDRALAGASGEQAPRRSAHGTHLGSRATVDVTAAGPLHLLASYGEGFRSPQARSLAHGERAPFTEVTSYEAGARARVDAIEGTLALFHTRLSRDLVFDAASARNEAAPASARTGLAAAVLVRPAPWLTASSSATYTRSVFAASEGAFVSGALVPYAPQLVARTDVTAHRTLGRALGRALEGRVGYGLQSLAGRPLPYGERGRDIFLVDTSAALRLGEVELALDAYNLLDAIVYDGQFVYASRFGGARDGSRVPERHVTLGPPRIVMASLALFL